MSSSASSSSSRQDGPAMQACFSEVEDPRMGRKIRHTVGDTLTCKRGTGRDPGRHATLLARRPACSATSDLCV